MSLDTDLEAAVERNLGVVEPENLPVRLRVDVARFGGDQSALAVWRGKELMDVRTMDGLDTMAVASWIASEINRREPKKVVVHEIGIGSGVVDRLRQMGHRVKGMNVASSATKKDLFTNTRAEIFWRLREALERGEVGFPWQDRLIAELSALRVEYTISGKIKLEKKAETKRRVGHSPDQADAVAHGYRRVRKKTGGTWGTGRRIGRGHRRRLGRRIR